jgi:serine/threonine protein kinase
LLSGYVVEDLTQKLVRLISEKDPDFNANAHPLVLKRIRQSHYYATLLLAANSYEDAFRLFSQACRTPQTETCARVLEENNISIGDGITMGGCSQATFLKAFEGFRPMVLKIPEEVEKVAGECFFYESVYQHHECFSEDVPLVPVKLLRLHPESSVQKGFSPQKIVYQGILMPKYASSLHDNPIPISDEDALRVGQRILSAIKAMHECDYLHADIKPGNIFVDENGNTWLGDYGSSVTFSNVSKFAGGTARYQCSDVPAELKVLFDYMGLALTLLEKCGVMTLRDGCPVLLRDVLSAISTVKNEQLRLFLTQLMRPNDEK